MNRLFYIIAFLLFFGSATAQSPEKFYETSFQEIGYNSLVVEGQNKRECLEVKFTLPEETNAGKALFPIMYLHTAFEPIAKGTAVVEVKINDFNLASFGPEGADCANTDCRKLLVLPKKDLNRETNRAEICLHSSNTITRVSLLNDSLIGLYASPKFEIQTIPEKTEIVLGETVKIRLAVKNTGSAAEAVEFHRAREIAADKEAFRIVDGNTNWEGVLEAGQAQEIVYTIKPRVSGPLSLPPAVLLTKNIFGGSETVVAKTAMITVRLPEKAVEGIVIKKQESAKVGEKTAITIALTNKVEQGIENIAVELLADLEVDGGKQKTLTLGPLETRNIEFLVAAGKSGTYNIGCSITYSDAGTAECGKQGIVFEEEGITPAVIIGLVFAIIAAGAYAYIHYSK